MAAHVKLLRAIQEGEVEPVGGRKPVKVDVRIISATNRNLIDDAKSGRFREDLFYRLHVFPISVPPLRDRAEDIPDLVRHFLARIAAEEGKRVRAIGADALALLGHYPLEPKLLCRFIQTNAIARARPNLRPLLVKRALIKGFIVSDHGDRFPAFLKDCAAWYKDGTLKHREDIVDGLDNAPAALLRLFDGRNFGKLIVRVSPDPTSRPA